MYVLWNRIPGLAAATDEQDVDRPIFAVVDCHDGHSVYRSQIDAIAADHGMLNRPTCGMDCKASLPLSPR